MPSVDNRVVRMEFDNAEFERKLQGTLASLAQLDKALKFEGAAKGFSGINEAAKGVNLGSIAQGVDHIASRFTALGAVAFSVIQSITTSALGMVKKIGGDILQPIIGGGKQRALNLEQAKFLFQGIGIDVNKAMDSARKAVLGTAYGLDEAAKAGAQFGASGVDAGDEMFKSLRAVAGVAAMTNSSFSEMADVFTQAAGQGKVSGYTLERISMRGLNAAAALGKQLHKSEAQIREMASNGEIDFKTFAMAMDNAFGAHAQEANKTYQGSLANLKAAMARLGAAVFTPQLAQQRDIFNAITPQVDKLKTALMPLIDAWTVLSTMSVNKLVKSIKDIDLTNLKKAIPFLTKGFVNIWVAITKIKEIAGTAFREIFPPSTVSALVKFSQGFLEFTKHLTIAGKTAENLKSIFKGVFSVMSIGWTIIKEGIKFITNLVGSISGLSSGGILSGLAKIGDFFTNLQAALVKGGGIKAFFQELTALIQDPIKYIKNFKDALAGLFTGFDPKVGDAVDKSVGRISDRLSTMKSAFERFKDIWRPFSNAMQKVIGVLDQIWVVIRNWFQELGQKIADTMQEGDFNAVLDALNVTLLGGIAALLTKWVKSGIKIDPTGGMFQSISQSFNQLTGVLKSMQTQIKADALVKIATAVGILTASVIALSLINSAALSKALTAMAVGFGQLMGAFAIINQMDSGITSGATFDLVAGGLIALSTAILILSGAVAVLGKLDWGQLLRGLTGVAALLLIMVLASKPLSDAGPGLIVAGVGLTAVGVGLNVIGLALKLFATMSWAEMVKGLVGVAGALVVIALAMQLMPSNLPLTGLGLIAVAAALTILGGALKIFASMSWSEIGKGLLTMAGALIIIGAALNLFPADTILIGPGLLLVAQAMVILGAAMKIMGGMSWGEIAKGLVAMAGGLILMAAAANAMSGAILGAVAIGIMAVSLNILADVLIKLSGLSWGDLLHGLVGVAAALAVLGLAALILEPVIPAMFGLGAALILIGAGFALIGVGAYGIAKAFEEIAKSGGQAAKALPEILKAIGKSMGALGRGVAEGVIEMVMTLAKAMPVLMEILGVFLNHLLDTIVQLIPKVKEAFMEYLDAFIQVVYEKGPAVIAAGLFLLISLIQGIRDNIQEIVTLVGEVITGFLDALSKEIPGIVKSLINLLTTIMTQVATGLGTLAATLYPKMGIAFINGFMAGINQMLPGFTSWFTKLPANIFRWVGNVLGTIYSKGVDLITGMLNGIIAKAAGLFSWVKGIAGKILGAVTTSVSTLWRKGWDVIQGLLNGISDKWQQVLSWLGGITEGIKNQIPNPLTLLKNIGSDIIEGLLNGIKAGWKKMVGWVADAASHLPGPIKKLFKLSSPSRVFMEIGSQVMDGFYIGIKDGWQKTVGLLENLNVTDHIDTNNIAKQFEAIVSDIHDSISNMDEFNPVITPVLDLTQIAADAAKISEYISPSPVATVSLTQASRIAADTNAAKSPDSTTTAVPAAGGVSFQQNIYAPEQLSAADIYKQTRNQITLAKEELKIP